MNVLAPGVGDERPRVAHFGGSFNPVHVGHVAVGRLLVERFGFERVIYTPNGRHYRKAGLAPEEDRLALLELSLQGHPKLRISTFELGRHACATAVETLGHLQGELRNEFPSFELFTVRGADALEVVDRWHRLPELMRLAKLLVLPRGGAAPESAVQGSHNLGDWQDRIFLLPATGLPATSSSDVRRAVYLRRFEDLPVAPGVLGEMRARGMYGLTPPGHEWIEVQRPGYAGTKAASRDRRRDELFGPGTWRTAFRWTGRTLRYREAVQLYEDAYLEHFRAHPEDLEWVVRTARDVYDNSDTNVQSGLDYSVQEALSTHLQDIAVRRCLVRLGRRFEGDRLVEIRGRDSEGFRLNPGEVPFHLPDAIVQPEFRSWWRPGSIESFWQSNKVLAVREGAFGPGRVLRVHLLLLDGDGRVAALREDSREVALPSFDFAEGRDWQDCSTGRAASLGARAGSLRPTAAEPWAEEVPGSPAVHILLVGEAADLPPGTEPVKLQTVRSSVRGRALRRAVQEACRVGLGGRVTGGDR